MDFMAKIMPILWHIVGRNKKCAVNVSTVDDKLTVSILLGKRRKSFSNHDGNIVLTQLKHYVAS